MKYYITSPLGGSTIEKMIINLNIIPFPRNVLENNGFDDNPQQLPNIRNEIN